MNRIKFVAVILAVLSLSACQTKEEAASSKQSSDVVNQKQSEVNLADMGIQLTIEDVIKIIEDNLPDVAITSVDLDTSFGKYIFEVTAVDDDYEFEIKINAQSGEIIAQESEMLDLDEKNGVEKTEEALDLSKLISIEKAGQLALSEVSQGEVNEWSLEKEMGITYWEVTVKNGLAKTSVKLNGQTGDILEIEHDD